MFGHKAEKYAGEIEYVGLDGKSIVKGIKQCCHCGNHWVPHPGSGKVRGFCFNCSGDTCSAHCSSECKPFEKQMDNIRRQLLRGD